MQPATQGPLEGRIVPPSPPAPPPVPPASPAPPTEPQEKAPEPGWNVGAGFSFGDDTVVVLGDVGTLTWASNLRAPSYRLSLERRLGPTTWLLLNGSMQHNVDDVLVQTEGDPPGERTVDRRVTSLGGFIGLRQLFISRFVDVSAFAGFTLARVKVSGDAPRPDEDYSTLTSQPGSYAQVYGLSGGIAVERELIPALAVRLSAEVFAARWTKVHRIQIIDDTPKGSDTQSRLFSLRFVPAIELRFYF